MQRRHNNALVAAALAAMLTGCAAVQVRQNTLQMVDSVSHIREVQVLRNLAAAISDHDMVPTQMLLSTGQASVSAGASPTLKMPHFGVLTHMLLPTSELDVAGNDTWTAQWQVAPVTNADDLRRLRNLYVLIVSTDEQYNKLIAYYNRHPEKRASATCYGLQTTVGDPSQAANTPVDHPTEVNADPSRNVTKQESACPPGYRSGDIPKWEEAMLVIQDGDSIGCKLYQEDFAETGHQVRAHHDSTKGIPFKRWLFWRGEGGAWLPETPATEPEVLGSYGGWEIGTTSRACFNDFIILVEAATPEAADAGRQGARTILNTR
jgi:hypothetical protein